VNRHERRKTKVINNTLQNYVHPDALQKLTDEVDRTACNSDRQYFVDNPQRQFRLRSAWPAEISIEELLNGPVRHGSHHYVLVKQIMRGIRQRAHIAVPDELDAPDDASCRALWDRCYAGDRAKQVAEIERVLRSFTPKEA
jgi:hypothetical protein